MEKYYMTKNAQSRDVKSDTTTENKKHGDEATVRNRRKPQFERSYSVKMRQALDKFKGRKRSRKYVLKENKLKPDVVIDENSTQLVRNEHFDEIETEQENRNKISVDDTHYADPVGIFDRQSPKENAEFNQISKQGNHVPKNYEPRKDNFHTNPKHRHLIKKHFSSPLHKRKNEIIVEGSPTYVSYQDDFTPELFPGFSDSLRNVDNAFFGVNISHSSFPSDFSSPGSGGSPQSDEVFEAKQTSHHQPQICLNNCGVFETKCSIPACNNMVKVVRPNGLENIMNTADLHASLDNALGILDQSTKLLLRDGPQSAPPLRPDHSTHVFGSSNRQRAYSTCSRLEPIAEEIDRVDDSRSISRNNNPTSSKELLLNEVSSHELINRTFSSRLERPHEDRFDAPNKQLPSGSLDLMMSDTESAFSDNSAYNSLIRPREKDLYGTIERTKHHSTSTISIKKMSGTRGDNLLQTFGSRNPGTSCSACDWAKLHMPFAGSNVLIPTQAWDGIMMSFSSNACGHYHAWGLCENSKCDPSLCHSHYLQFYQYLQRKNDEKKKRKNYHSCSSSQADSLIDYDINEVLSALDDVIYCADPPLTRHRFPGRPPYHARNKSNTLSLESDENHHMEKHQSSDTASINSDSAFSTNGSPTPSTRDGVNTDRDSLDSFPMHHNNDQFEQSNNLPKIIVESTHIDTNHENVCSWSHKSTKTHQDKFYNSFRHSLISSEDSMSPVNSSDNRDSAVYLHDSSSSHTTHLSSDSFTSSHASNLDRINLGKSLITGRCLSSVNISSSEESLVSVVSEGTLCLSDMEVLQSNRTGSNDSLFNPIRLFSSFTESAFIGEASLIRGSKKLSKVISSNTDTLTSSSGSDSNTLSSGSSGRSYLTLRSTSTSQSVYNTLDSSSCVSTDDTGDTIIYQGKKIASSPKMKYEPATFHYQNLTLPHATDKSNKRLRTISESSGKPNSYLKQSRYQLGICLRSYRSLSLSSIVTTTQNQCPMHRFSSSPSLYSSNASINLETAVVDYNENLIPTEKLEGTLSKEDLTDKIDDMLYKCSQLTSMLESLKTLLHGNIIQESEAQTKLFELEKTMHDKDKIMSQLFEFMSKKPQDNTTTKLRPISSISDQ